MPTPLRSLVPLATLLLFLVASPSAMAIDTEASMEIGFHAQSQDDGPGLFVISPHPRGHAQLTDLFFLEASLPTVGIILIGEGDDSDLINEIEGRDDNDFEFGNPYLGMGFHFDNPLQELQIRSGVTLPVARPDGASALAFGEGMRSGWEPWLWAPRRLSAVIGADFRQYIHEGLAVDTGVAFAPMFWMGDGSEDTEFAFQAHGGLTSKLADDTIETGFRLTAVQGRSLVQQGDDADLQMGIEPFGRLIIDDQVYSARLTVPLNEPYGFGFSSDGLWALHLGAGTRF